MNDFCKGQLFWDKTSWWSDTWLDLTECFQDVVFEIIPCAFLVFLSPIYVILLLSWQRREHPVCWIFGCKMLFVCLLGVWDTVACIVLWTREGHLTAGSLSLLVWILVIILNLFIINMERLRDLVRSMLMFTFWLMATLCLLGKLSSAITSREYDRDVFRLITTAIRFLMTSAIFILTCFSEYHSSRKEKDHNPETSASALSWIAFAWLERLMFLGHRQPLNEDDLFNLNPEDTSSVMNSKFEKSINKLKETRESNRWFRSDVLKVFPWRSDDCEKTQLIETSSLNASKFYVTPKYSVNTTDNVHSFTHLHKDKKTSFFSALVATFWWEFIYCNVGAFICVVMNLCAPFLLGLLIDFLKDSDAPSWHGYIYMLGLLATKIINSVFSQSSQYLCTRLAIRVRSAAIGAIFQKSLNISSEARRQSNLGEIVNLMSVDTNHLELFLCSVYWLWMSIPLLILAIFFLYEIIGLSMFAALGVICFLLVMNLITSQVTRTFQEKIMKVKDQRLVMLSEVLQGIKVIKLCGLEEWYMNKILDIRNKELNLLLKSAVALGVDTFAYTASTFWIIFFTLLMYVLVDESHHIDATSTFLTINFIFLIKGAIINLPINIRYAVKVASSIERINNFLQTEDLDPSNLSRNINDELAIRMIDANFSWEKSGDFTLKNINLEIKPGGLVAVVGPVGAGKSSLLVALLGEMNILSGMANLNSSVAYVPQQAWIQNTTVRNNILFGKLFDETLYQQVLEACALKPDLEMLPAGDMTEIGEKGVNLSGGQKQRVSLARAVYSQADIFLFDDPLSAVDSHVGKHIFTHVMGHDGLLVGKTRLLVTHSLNWLPDVDLIIVMNDGKISEAGTFEILTKQQGAFAKFLDLYLIHTGSEGSIADTYSNYTSPVVLTEKRSQDTRKSIESTDIYPTSRAIMDESCHDLMDKSKLITKEKITFGKVKWTVYLEILNGYGKMYAFLTAIMISAFHIAYNFSFIWLTKWNDDDKLANTTELPASSSERFDRNQYFIIVFAIFGVLQTLCCMMYACVLQYRHVVTSRVIHTQLLNGILKAPMSFFDTTPMGRILNRLSQDLDILDNDIFLEIEVYIEHSMFSIGILVIICYAFPAFITIAIPAIIIFFLVQQYYVKTSCQLRRIAAKNRSPVFAHFSEMLSGVSVIRAHQQQARFIVESEAKVDNLQKPMAISYAASKWMQSRLDIITYFFIIAVTILAILYKGNVPTGLVSLSLTYVLMMTSELTLVTRMSSELEANIVSVERMLEYSSLKPEAEWVLPGDSPALDMWPSLGHIEFVNYSTRYRDGLDLVLNDVSLTIHPGEKIGIVGRTGAGKSSLMLAMFRLTEAASGLIRIDGVDISKIGLHTLRCGVTILPQDPVLFAGSLRVNLDPFNKCSEDELWHALDLANLKPFVQTLSKGLEHEVGEGGGKLSMGQRQLVCLARTLLRKTKILILDEATAAVDMETDDLIQRTVRTAFQDSTVLTIAHRLNTVLDYDRILVLQNGKIIEFDSPKHLLAVSTSKFHAMVKEAGLSSNFKLN